MIHLRNEREIELIRQSCKIVAEALIMIEDYIKPGVKVEFLDSVVEKFIKSKGAQPSFKGYQGFPSSICVSVEDEVVHGIPKNKVLKEGQIVGIDIGAYKNGYHGDGAKTFTVGEVSEEKKGLMRITEESLYKGIEQAKIGNRVQDISFAIQNYVENAGFSVVRELVGHGVGGKLHEDPPVPNFGKPRQGPKLKAGMILAIEPMVNFDGYEVYTEDDGWTVRTMDGSPSAHYEHTVVITENGPRILTVLD
jgi:methionyl aminopeptidase